MLKSKFLYYILDHFLSSSFHKQIAKLEKNEKTLVIFDVGCYRGIFTKSMLDLIGNKKYKIYLFDINKKVKKYISYLLRLKNIYYNEVALSNKNGKANYNYNKFFEAAGSSLSSLVKNEATWNFTRKLVLLSRKEFVTYKVHTITLDSFVKKNKIKSIDILKIDIEGSEYELLKGAKNTLNKNKIKIILVEILAKKNFYIKKEKKILNFLKKRNFTLLKQVNIPSISLFSNIRGGDYLLVNKKYIK